MMRKDTPFGTMLREHRRRRNMSQSALAAKIGVSLNTIYIWESRPCRPSIGALLRLSAYLGCPLEELMELVEDGLDDTAAGGECDG